MFRQITERSDHSVAPGLELGLENEIQALGKLARLVRRHIWREEGTSQGSRAGTFMWGHR